MQLKWPMLWDLFSLFPAYAGVIPEDCLMALKMPSFPRIRGGDPHEAASAQIFRNFSPHTRG